MTAIEQIKFNGIYKSKAELKIEWGICNTTIDTRLKEIEDEARKGRYPSNSVIRDGGIIRVNHLVFIDYMYNRQRLLEPNLRTYVEPFDAYEIAKGIGLHN